MFVDKNGVNMEKKLVKQQLLTGERALFASKALSGNIHSGTATMSM